MTLKNQSENFVKFCGLIHYYNEWLLATSSLIRLTAQNGQGLLKSQ